MFQVGNDNFPHRVQFLVSCVATGWTAWPSLCTWRRKWVVFAVSRSPWCRWAVRERH